jgi:hypothetical protein
MAKTLLQIEEKLPHWIKIQSQRDIVSEMSYVALAVTCIDGYVKLGVSMPDSLWTSQKRKREVIENMIEQLTVQLATLTLEEK